MIAIYFFLITLFIRPQDWQGSLVYGWPVNDFIVIAGLFIAFANASKNKRQDITPVGWFLFAFICFGFITNIVNGNFDAGTQQFVNLFKRFCVFVMFVFIVDSPKKIKKVLFFSVLLCSILGVQSIHQSITGVGWARQALHTNSNMMHQTSLMDFHKYGGRSFWIGLWDGPNVLCFPFLFCIPFCLENIFRKKNKSLQKMTYTVIFALLSYGICLTKSRGGFIAFMCIVAMFFIVRFKARKALIICLLVLPIIYNSVPERMKVLNSEEKSAHERTWTWEQAFYMAKSNPIFGIGKGQFRVQTEYFSHSNYVENLSEMGFPGLLIYLSLLYWPLKNLFKIFNRYRNKLNDEFLLMSRVLFLTIVGFAVATTFVLMELDILYILCALSASFVLSAKNHIKNFNFNISFNDWGMLVALTIFITIGIWLIAIKEII
ncbi:MAG: O-antigen ligase family protein [Candidatus Omnitrophica bacterium]|nr:O-antigen ligase family protein [Candidatus Omnitrophota bacterium]